MSRLNSCFSLFVLFLCVFVLSSCSQKVYVVHYPSAEEVLSRAVPRKMAPVLPVVSASNSIKPLIMIDPGHGGKDFGTEAPFKSPFKEKNLNLMTAKILDGYLRQMGYRTLLTRNHDLFISLDKRAVLANANQPDLFVSIHYNSAPSVQAHGIEIFYYRSETNKERSSTSKILAEIVLKSTIGMVNAKSRGVKHGDLAVLRKTTMPAILIEGGFLTNENELKKLKDPSYIKSIAWGVAQGIQSYINQKKNN